MSDFNVFLYLTGGIVFIWQLRRRINGIGLLMQVAVLLVDMAKHYNDSHPKVSDNQHPVITQKIDSLYGKINSLPYSDRGDGLTYTSRG